LFILDKPERCHIGSPRQVVTRFTQVIVVDHLTVVPRPHNWALLTVVTSYTHVHLLASVILLNVRILQSA
jgi:hypothetical protein